MQCGTVSCTVNNLARNLAKVFGDCKTRGQVFRTVKHVDGLVLLGMGRSGATGCD